LPKELYLIQKKTKKFITREENLLNFKDQIKRIAKKQGKTEDQIG